jgi:chorismate mutase
MSVRGIRGATTADENTSESILDATTDLLRHMVGANGTQIEDIAAIYFTVTQDLDAEFPPLAARRMGWTDLALLCATEIPVPGSQDRCIRVLMLVNSEQSQRDVRFVYLKDAANLRDRGMKDEVQSLAVEE